MSSVSAASARGIARWQTHADPNPKGQNHALSAAEPRKTKGEVCNRGGLARAAPRAAVLDGT
eukprot:9722334-Alexandrium_andersonii.AAC.1